MIYDELALFYDALVHDDEATLKWVEYTERYVKKGKLLELACGLGDTSHILQQHGFDILATDISSSMVKECNKKYPEIKTAILDMENFEVEEQYDAICCYCDSINYLSSYDSLFKSVKKALKVNGFFLFDMHSLDRLIEFEDTYIEEGYVLDTPYQWTIQSFDDEIHQHFAFFEKNRVYEEQHIQKVFDPNKVLEALEALGFECEVYTDFDLKGIVEGEKYFIAAKNVKGER